MKIREHAKGRWPEIVSSLLGEQYANTRRHSPCPSGDGKDCYRFSNKNDAGNYFCKCSEGDGDGFQLLQCVMGWDFAEAARQVESVIGPCPKDGAESQPKPETWASRLRRETVKTDRSNYLASRGLAVAPGLEWHKALPYFDSDGNRAGTYPAMLAPVYRGGEFLTYHVTYLQGGKKAPLDPCRKILPAHQSMEGAAVPLYPAEGETLGIAEGVETAIAAAMLSDTPVWSALNTAILAKWQPPQGIKTVEIYGDNDANFAGHAAAYALAHRLAKRGIEAKVLIPRSEGDWNDWLLNAKRRVA